MIAPSLPALEEIRSAFVAFLPGLAGRLAHRFGRQDPEAQANAVAEGVGLAWEIYLSARLRGKAVAVTTLAFYAGKCVAAGRKLVGTSTTDALSDSPAARQHHGSPVSLEGQDLSPQRLCRTFGDRRWRWPILEYIAPCLDLEAFQKRCSSRDRRILELKAAGYAQTEIAAQLGITPPAVCQRLGILRRRWEAISAMPG